MLTIMLFALLQAVPATPLAIDLMKVDFTAVKGFRSDQASILGIKVGDKASDARAGLEKAGYVWKDSVTKPPSEGLETLHHPEVWDSKGNTLLVLVLRGDRIESVIIQSALGKKLAGNSARLFNRSIINKDSPLRFELLGREDHQSANGSTVYKFIQFEYDKEGLRVRGLSLGLDPELPSEVAITLELVKPAKVR